MASNLALDDGLLNHAMEVGGFKTKRETVTVALNEFIQRREMVRITELFGAVDFDEGYNYKLHRTTR
jgi:Arc/MetJ family transcription regulator